MQFETTGQNWFNCFETAKVSVNMHIDHCLQCNMQVFNLNMSPTGNSKFILISMKKLGDKEALPDTNYSHKIHFHYSMSWRTTIPIDSCDL